MNEKVRAGLEFLRLHEGIAFAPRDIEDALGFKGKTVASEFGRMADQGREGLERAKVKRPDTSYNPNEPTDEYQGFRYVGEERVGNRRQFVVRGTAWLEEVETP